MKCLRTLTLFLILCLAARSSVAQRLHGMVQGSPPSSLVLIDQSDASIDSIGYTGFHWCGCMDQNPADGKMYAICNRENENTNVLITIDLCTGEGTEVAPINDGQGNNFGLELNWAGMSFRSDGVLFAYNDTAYAPFTIDVGTGTASKVGDYPLIDLSCEGLTFSLTDSLYLFATGFSTLYVLSLDQTTGQDDIIFYQETPCEGMSADVHPVTGEIWGINEVERGPSRPESGRSLLAPSSFTNDLKIISLDGTLTTIGAFPKRVEAIAFADEPDCVEPVAAIPTMGEWFLWLFGLILVTLFIVTLYEKRRIDVLKRK